MNKPKILIDSLKSARESKHLTIDDVAKATSMSPSRIKEIEDSQSNSIGNKTVVYADEILKLMDYYNISAKKLKH